MNLRRGFTLIETVITLSIVIAMLGATLGLVALVRTSSRRASEAAIDRQEIRRLAKDIRRDVASADSVDVTESQLILKSNRNDSRIIYQLASEALFSRRVESAEAKLEASDRYLIDAGAQVELRLQPNSENQSESSLVELTITLPDRPDHPLQILAAPRMQN